MSARDYVKLPGLFLLTSLFDPHQIACVVAGDIGHDIKPTGTLNSGAHTGNRSGFVNDIFCEQALNIQADYEHMNPERIERNRTKIEQTPNKEDFRAHQTYLRDLHLLELHRARHAASGQ